MPPRSPITVGIAVETTVASRAPIARARISPTTVNARLVRRGIGRRVWCKTRALATELVRGPRRGQPSPPARRRGGGVEEGAWRDRSGSRRARQSESGWSALVLRFSRNRAHVGVVPALRETWRPAEG